MIFYIILISALLLLTYMFFEAIWVKVTHISLSNSGKGLKLVHLSDIHINMLRISAKTVRKIIKRENPDILILTGDYIEKPVNTSCFLDFLQQIKITNKTYLCLGNHDHKAFAGNKEALGKFIYEIEALQTKVLVNKTVQIEKGGDIYNIIGIDDLRMGRSEIKAAKRATETRRDIEINRDTETGRDIEIKGDIEINRDTGTNIVITHNPDLSLLLSSKDVDYLFCGHFHGGQIWMPFNLEFILLRKDELCKKGKSRGLHVINGIKVYINRGLGTVELPFRFLSRPEITVAVIDGSTE